jgi:pentatricopeptide repeat protein
VVTHRAVWGHARRLEWSKAEQILKLMETKGVSPDLMTFSYLLSCMVDATQLERARELYREMREKWNIR